MTIEALPIGELLDSFDLHLRALNRSPKTIHSYRLAVDQLWSGWDRNRPTITKADIEGFIAHFLENRASATARQRYASLQQFFKWTTAEGEIPENPMEKIDAPRVDEQPVPILTVNQLALSLPPVRARPSSCA